MILSQITVIAVLAVIAILVGILLVYARILAGRVGKTNATLRRIEEVLIAANAPGGRAGSSVASMEVAGPPLGAPGPEMPVREMVPLPERDHRVSFLTVRDLKVMSRSGRRRSDPALNESAALASAPTAAVDTPDEVVAEAREEVYAYSELSASVHGAVPEVELVAMPEPAPIETPEVAGALATELASEASIETHIPAENPTVLHALDERADYFAAPAQEPIAASPEALLVAKTNASFAPPAENLDSKTTSVEDQPAPISGEADAELAERRKRNADMILAGQRRRRRSRGY